MEFALGGESRSVSELYLARKKQLTSFCAPKREGDSADAWMSTGERDSCEGVIYDRNQPTKCKTRRGERNEPGTFDEKGKVKGQEARGKSAGLNREALGSELRVSGLPPALPRAKRRRIEDLEEEITRMSNPVVRGFSPLLAASGPPGGVEVRLERSHVCHRGVENNR